MLFWHYLLWAFPSECGKHDFIWFFPLSQRLFNFWNFLLHVYHTYLFIKYKDFKYNMLKFKFYWPEDSYFMSFETNSIIVNRLLENNGYCIRKKKIITPFTSTKKKLNASIKKKWISYFVFRVKSPFLPFLK